VNITIYRGTREIGGSCVELSHRGSRIIIDIGMPLVQANGERFDSAASRGKSGPELLEAGVLPNVQGLYTWQTNEQAPTALLVSHAHMDHYGLLHHVRGDMPVYMSDVTKSLIEITDEFLGTGKPPAGTTTFGYGQPIRLGEFTVTPYMADHSACDSAAFMVEADGKRVFYTGDFRNHGRTKKKFDYLIERVASPVDALLMEGTMLGRNGEDVLHEEELERRAVEIFKLSRGPVLIWQSGQHIDRHVTFYRAAKQAGRRYLIDPYAAEVLHRLHKLDAGKNLPYPSKNFPEVGVFYPSYLKDKAEICFRFKQYKVEREEIAANPGKYVLQVRLGMMRYLNALNGLDGGAFIYSLWPGYLDDEKNQKLIDYVKSQGMTFEHLHTSGHATLDALQQVAKSFQPQYLIPIHTFHPEDYAQFGQAPTLLADGDPFEI
jgi:ribonuclease J